VRTAACSPPLARPRLLEHGSPKHAWVNPAGQTMGRSPTVKDDDIFHEVVVPWVRHQFGR